MTTTRILRRPQVEEITGLRRTRIDELERLGRFSWRIRLSDRAVGWRSDELQAWLDALPRAAEQPTDIDPRTGARLTRAAS